MLEERAIILEEQRSIKLYATVALIESEPKIPTAAILHIKVA